MAIVRDYIEVNQTYSVYPYISTSGSSTIDLTGATLQIKSVSPAGVVTLITATESTYNSRQILDGTVTPAINNESGDYTFQTWITFSGDTTPTPGKPYVVTVNPVVT